MPQIPPRYPTQDPLAQQNLYFVACSSTPPRPQLPCKEVELVLRGGLVLFSAVGKFGLQILEAALCGL